MQNTMRKNQAKAKKTILILDHNGELEKLVKEPLIKRSEDLDFFPLVVTAKDGADAALKSANQKFDLILIDVEAPRLMDGGFVKDLHTFRNTHEAQVFVFSPPDLSHLPDSLKGTSFFKKPVSSEEIVATLISALNSKNHDLLNNKQGSGSHKTSKLGVDARVVNAIITATLNVLNQFGLNSIKMEKAEPRAAHDPLLGEVSSIVDIKSKSFQGHLSVSFDKESFLELVSAMLMEEQTELTPDNQDAVGEINNIIFGNAKSEITSYGVQMTVPRVVMGANQAIPCAPGAAGMLVPFSTDKGKFYLTIVADPLIEAA